MKGKEDTAAETPEKDTRSAPATDVKVWFVVEKNGAVIGESHHSAGKRMELPKGAAEEAVNQGLGRIDGVVI